MDHTGSDYWRDRALGIIRKEYRGYIITSKEASVALLNILEKTFKENKNRSKQTTVKTTPKSTSL